MGHAFDMIGLGYCGLDYCCLCPRIPLDDKVEAEKTLTQGGGPAATATYAAAKLGANAAFLSAVGDDDRGCEIMKQLENVGVYTSNMAVRQGAESPSAFCWTDSANGQRSIVWTKGTTAPLRPEEISEELIASARVLHLDGHQTEAAIQAAKYARKHGASIIIDSGTITSDINKLLELSDIIIASEKFMETYYEAHDPEEAVRKMFRDNARFTAVTLGKKGSYGFDGKTVYFQPTFDVEVVDTTGAGDVFHGAFAARYLKVGEKWDDCLRFATAVASLKCTEFGGRTGIPDLEKADKFLRSRS